MKHSSILLTGSTGFIGKNILPILSQRYSVLAPSRLELDLSDDSNVRDYLARHQADYLVHCAILDPAKDADAGKGIYDDTVSVFKRLTTAPFRKIIYVGSGAEYDKSGDIILAQEDNLESANPTDEYGRAKRDMTLLSRASANIYNARIFGCYGPEEPERRFIRHAIDCCLRHEPISIRQDCRFSYVFVQDLGQAIIRMLDGQPRHHDYNLCGGRPWLLSELANIVKHLMKSDVPVQVGTPGLASEYTGDDTRFVSEFHGFKYTPIEDGIMAEINWMKGFPL